MTRTYRLSTVMFAVSLGALSPLPAQQKPRGMLLPQAVVLPKGDREIAIDGSLIDWPKLPALRLNHKAQLSGTAHGAWRGPGDAGAMVFLMWDDDGLFIAASVRDEWHRALDATTLQMIEIPPADSLVFTFDPERNTRGSGLDPGRREDREFWLADETGRQVVQWDRFRGSARVLNEPARVVVLHDKEQELTTYEAMIPWREILPPGKSANIGTCIDLQMVLNDFDESTDPMPQTRIGWTFGLGPVIDPGLLGTLMLVGDDSALRGQVPAFPPKPATPDPAARSPEYWRELTANLLKRPPSVYDGKLTPEEVGGVERLRVLEELDEHCARMPRVEYLELNQRIHRRMNREVAGLEGRGLPYWWAAQLESLAKRAADPVADDQVRLFRLPMGGWLVRSPIRNYLIDPAGSRVAELLWGAASMCVLTQPLDMTRRNDQLLIRMFTAKPIRPVWTHVVFHLPMIAMDKIPVVQIGTTYGTDEVTSLQAVARTAEETEVSYDSSYRITSKGVADVVTIGPSLRVEDVPETWRGGVMIASARNLELIEIANLVAPQVILFDDAFMVQSRPDVKRVTLRELHQLQRALLPHRSVLLAPGESWTVTRQ